MAFQKETTKNSLYKQQSMSKEQFSFNKGWSQVKNGDVRKCRKKLMEALGITTRMAFFKPIKGRCRAESIRSKSN